MSTLTPNPTLIEIGKRMKLEKARLGIKNIKVCLELDVHLSTYLDYEAGKRDIPVSKLSLLGSLGFDVAYILTGVENKSQNKGIANELPSSLIQDYDDDAKTTALLSAMNNAENTLKRADAKPVIDYNYVDLANIGMQLMNYRVMIEE